MKIFQGLLDTDHFQENKLPNLSLPVYSSYNQSAWANAPASLPVILSHGPFTITRHALYKGKAYPHHRALLTSTNTSGRTNTAPNIGVSEASFPYGTLNPQFHDSPGFTHVTVKGEAWGWKRGLWGCSELMYITEWAGMCKDNFCLTTLLLQSPCYP